MAIAAAGAAAVERAVARRLEAARDPLPVIVAERAQHRPLDAIGVHRSSGLIELLAERRIDGHGLGGDVVTIAAVFAGDV